MKELLTIEDARIVFKNFEGAEDKYNRKGDRNFAVVIDDIDQANELIADGWNLKLFKPRDDQDQPAYYLPVSVVMNSYTTVKLVRSHDILDLDEDTVETLDNVELENIDLVLRPYDWEVNGKTGRKAYLKTLYAVLAQDDFAEKYSGGSRSGRVEARYCGHYHAL